MQVTLDFSTNIRAIVTLKGFCLGFWRLLRSQQSKAIWHLTWLDKAIS
jgi:hypothetical protein